MPIRCLLVPDDVLHPAQLGKNKSIRPFQYVNFTMQENFDASLTHHTLVYILSGVKQIKIGSDQFDIRPGKLFLVLRGEYAMSECIIGEHGFRSLMLSFSKRVA